MTATYALRRTKTARELAEEFHVHPRTVQRIAAEPGECFLVRSEGNRKKIIHLRQQGMKIKDIATMLSMPMSTVGTHIAKSRKLGDLPSKSI